MILLCLAHSKIRFENEWRSSSVCSGSYRGPPGRAALIWQITPVIVSFSAMRTEQFGNAQLLPERANSRFIFLREFLICLCFKMFQKKPQPKKPRRDQG